MLPVSRYGQLINQRLRRELNMPDPDELEEKAQQSEEDAEKLREAADDARNAEDKEQEAAEDGTPII
jgi:hypothetical protein